MEYAGLSVGITPIGSVQSKVLQQMGIGNIGNTRFITIKRSYDKELF
jgi:hypothetical protein